MKRKHILLIITLLSISICSLYGCSSKEKTEQPSETTDETTPVDDTEDVETPPADEENEEYMNTESTPLEEIQGEGAQDDTVPDPADTEDSLLGKPCKIPGGTLTVQPAVVTDERDASNQSQPEKVIVIDYEYTCESSTPMLIDDMSFKLVIGDTVCTPYYCSFTTAADLIQEGESCSAQLAYEVPADAAEATLFYLADTVQAELSYLLEF